MVENEDNFRWQYIQSEYLVRILDGAETDWYIINNPEPRKSNTIDATVTCPHISELLKTKNIYLTFDDTNGIGTLRYLAEQILAGTGWTIGYCETFLEKDGVTEKVRSLKSNNNEGAYALISKMCNLFNAYPEYHGEGKTVDFFSLNDNRTEWEFVVGKNLNEISVNYDSGSIVTRLYVEGEYGDYGYVGIEDVNPTGLNCLLNFDYYKNLGMFTAVHQTALDNYLSDSASKKAEITAAQAALIEATNRVVTAVGSAKLTVYTLKPGDNNDKVIDQTYRVNGATETPGSGADMIGIISDSEYEHFENNLAGSYDSSYIYLIYFENAALGQIGVNESVIIAKESSITGWQEKIELTTDVSQIAEYEAEIAKCEEGIQTTYEGTDETDGLYKQMYDLAIDGIALNTSQTTVNTKLAELDAIEAVFVAAMGDMLRDGRWSDDNYAPGQEESLYQDALDMSDRCAKPKATYSMTYQSAYEYMGWHPGDVSINAVGHIWDKHLGINERGYIKSITIVHDNEKENNLEITTDDGFSKQVSLESVLTRIAQMAEIVKAKNALYDRAGAINSNGELAANRLNGLIDVMRNKLSSVVSNWYTDDRGNLIFESVSGNGAMMLCGEGFMIAADRNADGTWNWRTLGDGTGIVADEITTGFLSAERILAGSITADKIVGNYGQIIDISQNNHLKTAVQEATDNAVESAGTMIDQTAQSV